MADRRRATKPLPADHVDASSNGVAPTTIDADAAESDEADAILSEAQGANPRPPKSAIYRVNPETGTQQWLAEVATSLLSLEYVGKRFGGGKYHIRHRKVQASGGYKYAGNDVYEIDPSVKPEAAPAPAPSSDAIAPPGGNIADTILNAGVLQMLQQMNAQNQLTLAMVERMRKTDDQPRTSVPELLTAAAPIVAAIIGVFKDRKDSTELALKRSPHARG